LNAEPSKGVAADKPPLQDPHLAGFVNSYFPSAVKQQRVVPKFNLHSLPELALFADWETTVMMAPVSLQSSKTSYLVYSAQYAKVLARFAWYLDTLKQHIASLRMQY